MITSSYDKNDVSQVKAVKLFQKFRNDNGKKRIGLMGNMESGFNLGDNSATVVAIIGRSSIERNQLLNLLIEKPVFGVCFAYPPYCSNTLLNINRSLILIVANIKKINLQYLNWVLL